ncbi:MAG: DNA polymerase Y family protein [Deltaproteobacteria bacterium]|nr:DNA polymerase Y family protein [Deltaproteobacteria bacterium]
MDRLACVDVAAPRPDSLAGVFELLVRFTPEVEPCADEPGVFWLNPTGLGRLYRSPKSWADAVRDALARAGFASTLAVGFTRFGVYALARTGCGVVVLRDPGEEQRLLREVPLARLGLPPAVREGLGKLGVRTIADLLCLPAADLLERFGEDAHHLWRMACGDLCAPLQPQAVEEPIVERSELEAPEDNAMRLTFAAKHLLSRLLRRVAAHGEAVLAIDLSLTLDQGDDLIEEIRPAALTLDEVQLVDLVRLRLEALGLKGGVVGLTLAARTARAEPAQLELFATGHRRNLEAADRAFARLRAELGPDAVVRARPREGHLPEACYCWEPLEHMPSPCAPRHEPDHGLRTLVRRIHARPLCGPVGVSLRDMEEEPMSRPAGTYTVSGGWWRHEVHREYHFAETSAGHILWAYYDRCRRRWFIQGSVE